MTENEVISELNEIMGLTGATDIKQGRVLDEFLKRHPNSRSISKDVYDNTIPDFITQKTADVVLF